MMCRPKGAYEDAINRNAIALRLGYSCYDDAIYHLYKCGHSSAYIGGVFECSWFCIRQRLIALGVVMRQRGGDRKGMK